MQNKKYLSMLGLARRAGRLAMGHDAAKEAVKKHQARLLVFASDISPRLYGEFDRTAPEVPAVNIGETMDALHLALGYRAGVIAVTDENFARRILELTEQEENAYGDKS